MDRDELILREYESYCKQKENFINRNFCTNRFYMVSIFVTIIALIFTGNVMFLNKISATLIFAIIGICICVLWWMNVDSYNILIKIKYANVIEEIEKKFPIKPFSDEYQAIQEYKKKRVFMFSDIQKIIAVILALFFFAICINEISPMINAFVIKLIKIALKFKSGI